MLMPLMKLKFWYRAKPANSASGTASTASTVIVNPRGASPLIDIVQPPSVMAAPVPSERIPVMSRLIIGNSSTCVSFSEMSCSALTVFIKGAAPVTVTVSVVAPISSV